MSSFRMNYNDWFNKLESVIFQTDRFNYELVREKIISEEGYNYFRALQLNIFKKNFSFCF